jgi:hypothetical protein
MTFGRPTRFHDHGILLPCEHAAVEFKRLRQLLLHDPSAREHGAHITLAHPRNPRSAGNEDANLADFPQALVLQFASVALIEQQGSEPWRLIHEADLGANVQGSRT